MKHWGEKDEAEWDQPWSRALVMGAAEKAVRGASARHRAPWGCMKGLGTQLLSLGESVKGNGRKAFSVSNSLIQSASGTKGLNLGS